MKRPPPTQMARARRLLAHEGAAASPTDGPTTSPTTSPTDFADASEAPAGRVYDKLHTHLAPLVGVSGVQLLFVRSAKQVQGAFAGLAEGSILEDSTRLRALLQAQDPAVPTESAAALFGTFFVLVTTFIGERLTLQILRSAWPTMEHLAEPTDATENKK